QEPRQGPVLTDHRQASQAMRHQNLCSGLRALHFADCQDRLTDEAYGIGARRSPSEIASANDAQQFSTGDHQQMMTSFALRYSICIFSMQASVDEHWHTHHLADHPIHAASCMVVPREA